MKIAIVGAGIAGLSCAARLNEAGFETALFDKGRRPGGRLSTLRIDDMAWDFGAQYLRDHGGAFSAQVAAWRDAGVLTDWPAGPAGALVGVPGMGALVEAECARHAVRFEALVQRIERVAGGEWYLRGANLDEGPFDAVVLAIPAEQAAPLLSLHDLSMAREAAAAPSLPCWTVMTAFPAPLPCPSVIRDAGAISWAARDNSKPGRSAAECWVIQASADWSRRHLEETAEQVAARLLALFGDAIGFPPPEPRFLKAHRWRFAMSYGQRPQLPWNADLRLGACGDWCTAPRIEGAWRSGHELANRIVAQFAPNIVLAQPSIQAA